MPKRFLPQRDECTCLAVRQAARHITQFYDQHLTPAGLRTTQFSILAKLKRLGPMTINALADELVMDRTTLGRNILPLEREGLISIVPGRTDRRSKELSVTTARNRAPAARRARDGARRKRNSRRTFGERADRGASRLPRRSFGDRASRRRRGQLSKAMPRPPIDSRTNQRAHIGVYTPFVRTNSETAMSEIALERATRTLPVQDHSRCGASNGL